MVLTYEGYRAQQRRERRFYFFCSRCGCVIWNRFNTFAKQRTRRFCPECFFHRMSDTILF